MPWVRGGEPGLAAARDVQDGGLVDARLSDLLDRLDELREGIDGLEGHGSFLVRVKMPRGVQGLGGDAWIELEQAIEGRGALRGEGFGVWEAVRAAKPNPDRSLMGSDLRGDISIAESQPHAGRIDELLPRRPWRDVFDPPATGRQRLLGLCSDEFGHGGKLACSVE